MVLFWGFAKESTNKVGVSRLHKKLVYVSSNNSRIKMASVESALKFSGREQEEIMVSRST